MISDYNKVPRKLSNNKNNLLFIGSAKTLVISYVGMIAREVPVQDVLRVVLQSGTQNLEEVVVTAIGMKKQEKALGYAASTVKSEDLNAAKSGSVMSGLLVRLRV